MSALNVERVTAEVVGAHASGAMLLFTFLGGALFFFGPIIGGVLMVVAQVLLSEITKAWLLYLGLIFLLMVMYAPGGIASLIMMNVRVAAFGMWRRLWKSYVGLLVAALVFLGGMGAIIEMVYHLKLNVGLAPEMKYLWLQLNTASSTAWLASAAVAAAGLLALELLRRDFARRWGRIQEDIQAELLRRGGH